MIKEEAIYIHLLKVSMFKDSCVVIANALKRSNSNFIESIEIA